METFVGISAWPGIKLEQKQEREKKTLNQTNNPHCSFVYSSIKHIERLFDFVGVCSWVRILFPLFNKPLPSIIIAYVEYGSKQAHYSTKDIKIA